MKPDQINDWEPETLSLVTALLAAGFTNFVSDNTDSEHKHDGDVAKLVSHLVECDDAKLYCKAPDGQNVWLHLIYGNDPGEMISDYSVHDTLETVARAENEKWYGQPQPVKTRGTKSPEGFTGVTFRACVHAGQGYLMSATSKAHPCGCRIIGNGTLTHPLEIVFCAAHAAVKGGEAS